MRFSNEDIPVKSGLKLKIPQGIAYKTSEKLSSRDPFIMLYDGKYYFYRCAGKHGVECIVSDDLENWSSPVPVFVPPENYHGIKDLHWAPECHYYKGNFYIFTSVWSDRSDHRNVCVYRSASPLGPFEEISDGAVGKPEWDTIDGTFYVDGDGQPWMAFVHEWTCMPDKIGAMAVAKLSDDLTHFVSEPVEIFRARDPEWARNGVTDGPYMYKTEEGKLFMIWSNHGEKGYVVAKAYSDNGKIDGKWIQDGLLYAKDLREDFVFEGGHAMIFKDKEGRILIALHTPNSKADGNYEHLLLRELIEKDGTIMIK